MSVGCAALHPRLNLRRHYVATFMRRHINDMGHTGCCFLCRHFVAWEGGRVNVRGLRCATPTAKFAPPLRGYDTKPAFQKMSKNRKVGNEETPKSGKSAKRQVCDTGNPEKRKVSGAYHGLATPLR